MRAVVRKNIRKTGVMTIETMKFTNICPSDYVLFALLLRSKARGLAQPGSPPGWLKESDPAGVILYVMD